MTTNTQWSNQTQSLLYPGSGRKACVSTHQSMFLKAAVTTPRDRIPEILEAHGDLNFKLPSDFVRSPHRANFFTCLLPRLTTPLCTSLIEQMFSNPLIKDIVLTRRSKILDYTYFWWIPSPGNSLEYMPIDNWMTHHFLQRSARV